MGKSFDQLVKEKGSVSAALASQGYSKGSSGSWSKGGSSKSSGGSSGSSGGSSRSSGGSGYYDPNKDYSLAIKQAQDRGASDAELSQLRSERQNKVNDRYGGVDPYQGTSDIMGTGGGGSRRPSGGGSVSSGGGSTGGSGGIYGVPVVPKSTQPPGGGMQWAVNDRPDMGRRTDLAGGYATSGGYTVFYDQDGYATKAVKGHADYRPSLDPYVTGGSYGAAGAWTDQEILTAEDQRRIADIRARMQSGLISGDEANAQANAIRSGYGYTIDKAGNVTDLAGLARVDARRAAWGLTDQGPSSEQVALLQTLYPNGSSLLNQLYEQGFAQDPAGQAAYQPTYQPTYQGAYQGSGADEYLRDLYAANVAAQLAALRATYEQNVADVRAQDDLISTAYAGERNRTASQNELQRMQMNEFAIAQGLNTGAAGQLALAQNAALQGSLAELGSQETQSLSENAMNLQKLTAAYRNAIDQAEAEGNLAMASALYEEYVRQENLAWQQWQAAQEQANWERQFQFAQAQQQQSLAGQDRESARNLVMTMLGTGVMPDAATLAQAGISAADAQAILGTVVRPTALPRSGNEGGGPDRGGGTVSGMDTKKKGLAKTQFDGLKLTMQTLVAQGDPQAAQRKFDQMEPSLSQDQINALINAGLITKE